MMPDRRRWRDVSGARFDTARRLALALWPFAASLAAVAVLLAAVVVSVRAIRDRDRFEDLAHEVRRSADASTEASEGNRRLLQQAKPCAVGDPPDTPSCQRKEAADAYVRSISERLAAAISVHDANTGRDHAALQRRLGVVSALPPRTPITAAPRPVVRVPPDPPQTTPTTPCDRLPNGKCRR